MTKLRLVPYGDLRKIVEKAGFYWVRREGSHNIFRNIRGQIIIMPDHGSQVIVRSLLRKILRDVGLSTEEYHRLLDEV